MKNTPAGKKPAALAFAILYIQLKEKNKVIEYLNEALLELDSGLTLLKVIPLFDFLRDDPRFKEIRKKANFPE